MVGTNLKAETLALTELRTQMETEMNAIISRLCAPGGPGLSGNLLDAEGFPRADIDIPNVRGERQRLAVLRSDHKEITEKIEKSIHVLHSGSVSREPTVLPQKRAGEELVHQRTNGVPPAESLDAALPNSSTLDLGPTMAGESFLCKLPFAVFDEVQEGSPAARDGILQGDQLLKFGSVEGGENLISRLASEGYVNEGTAIPVVVLRHGNQVQLNVTPRLWSGRGLLGCHVQPL